MDRGRRSMTIDEQKQIARQVFDAFADGDVAPLQGALAPGAVIHQCGFLQPISGESFLQGGFRPGSRIRDRMVRLEHMIGEGDILALHWRTTGHHAEPEPPKRDGTPVNFSSMTFVRFEDARIAEIWNIQDTATLQSQLREAASSNGAGAE